MIRTTYLLTSLTVAALRLTSNTEPRKWKGNFLPNEISDPNQNPFKSKLINWIMGGVIDWLHLTHTHACLRFFISQQMDQFCWNELFFLLLLFVLLHILIESIKNNFCCLLSFCFIPSVVLNAHLKLELLKILG